MSTSEKTFTQVKDILRKLERSIDEAREKRLHHDDDDLGGAPQSPRAAEPGRAQPLNASARQDASRTSSSPGWMSR